MKTIIMWLMVVHCMAMAMMFSHEFKAKTTMATRNRMVIFSAMVLIVILTLTIMMMMIKMITTTIPNDDNSQSFEH